MSNYAQPQSASPPPAGRNWLGCLLTGCLAVIVLMVVLCLAGAIAAYIFRDKIVDKIAEAAVSGAKQAINQSELKPEDKKIVTEQFDRVVKAYREGELSNEQVQRLFETVVESPLVVVGMVFVIEQQFVVPSGLSAEEKAAAHRTLERTARGLYEEKISQDELDQIMPYIANKKGNGEWEFKQKITDEELRAFLAECQELADNADIPNEPFEVNIGEEVRKAVDAVLGEQQGSLPAP